jgi:hypothetical protein
MCFKLKTSDTGRKWVLVRVPQSARSAGFLRFTAPLIHSPFTAADEKITLSVVQVNNKPQHLVFCLHFLHPDSKHWDLAVESSKHAVVERPFAFPNCFIQRANRPSALDGSLIESLVFAKSLFNTI